MVQVRDDNCVAKQVERGGEEDMDSCLNIKVIHAHRVPCDSVVKNPPANAGDTALIPESGRSPREVNDYPLQSSCLGNPMGR